MHCFKSKVKSILILILLNVSIDLCSQNVDVKFTQLNESINIDGNIDAAWQLCDSIALNYQLEPDFGKLPSRVTTVKIAQHQEYLYFLFICQMASPNEVVATITQRDKLDLNDDFISIMVDTYNDNHNAILFQVNPLSTLTDAKITNDGKNINYLWDSEWEGKSTINRNNWVAEVKIPLRSIQFDPKTSVWGCNFSRSFRANQEIIWWQKVTENYRVSQSGQLSGLQFNETKKHHLSLYPYASGRYENSDVTGNYNKPMGDAGIDIQYKYASNINANIAINPDFATVEGDKEQINLTPWELKFPEKRIFFQDGNEMFDTRIQTFYSRRIGDMAWGGKAIGKIGKYQFNSLIAKTTEDINNQLPSANFNAFRLKRDFLSSSSLGLTYTNKITDTLTYHTYSADLNLNLQKQWKLTGQFVATTPGSFASHSSWYLRLANENNTYHYHVRYSEVGDDFKSNLIQTGFITDDNRKEIDSDVEYKFWFNGIAKYIKLSGKNNIYWSQLGTLRSWYLTYGGRGYLKNKLSLDLYYNNEYKNQYKKVYDNYNNYFYRSVLGYNTDENNNVEIGYQRGVNYNRDYSLLELKASVQVLKKMVGAYEFTNLQFTPDPTSESTLLNIVSLSYYQTKDLWLKIFAQHSSNNNRIYLYGLAGWRFKPPFGALYLIYSSDSYEEPLQPYKIESKILFVKLTMPINIIN